MRNQVEVTDSGRTLQPYQAEFPMLEYDSAKREKLTHQLFRYPAKFHPPVARALIERFSRPGELILDPFCGSGTILVEARAHGRNAIGLDWDPVAVFISNIKSHSFNVQKLRTDVDGLMASLQTEERAEEEYTERQWQDLTEEEYTRQVESGSLWIPEIPNLHHWFRKYVTIDMARILGAIEKINCPNTHKNFMRLCFCSIIRACSNADPVPVSGLEVTSYMIDKEQQGRPINPFKIFRHTMNKSLKAVQDFAHARVPKTTAIARRGDAINLSAKVRKEIDCVITSPPYYTAVDYYRRHQLEMYWLGFTRTQEERKTLIPGYIGRTNVSSRNLLLKEPIEFGPIGTEWLSRLEQECRDQVNSFKHYAISMDKVLKQMALALRKEGKAIVVIGNNRVKGMEMPTVDIIAELAKPTYQLVERNWYAIKDRHMSYSRNHGADIDTEHVLILESRAPCKAAS